MRRFLLNVSLLLVSIVFTLGIAEVAVRLCFPVQALTRVPLEYLNENRTGFKPHTSWTIVEPEFTEEVSINSLGYRDGEIDRSRATIAFLGDSQTYGTGLAHGERVSDLIAARLKTECPESTVQVLNVAMPGGSTYDEERYLQDIIAKGVNVKAAFLNVVTNDHYANLKQRRLEKTQQQTLARRVKPGTVSDWIKSIRYKSRLLQLVIERLAGQSWFTPLYNYFKLDLGMGEFVSLQSLYLNENASREQMDATKESVAKISSRVPTSMIVIPDKYRYVEALQRAARAELSKKSGPEDRIDFDRESKLLREIAAELSLEFLEPIESFRAHPAPATLAYSINGHLTPAGARLLADYIWEHSKFLEKLCHGQV